jgi:hypothetical protein
MMTAGRRFKSIFATLLLLTACTLTAAAQDPSEVSYPPNGPSAQGAPGAADAPGQTNTDPPGRVARIQYIGGQVSIQPGGVNDWVAASMNRPLTTSDRVWTDANSKAELSVGGGYIRMNSEASLTLTNVSDQTVQLEVDQGTLELTVRYLGPGQIYEVDTANLAFTVMKPGVYRFDVFPQQDATWVTVRKGYGEATGRGAAVKVKSGQQARFGNGASLQYTAEAAPSPDGFDDWASVRDKRLDSSVSAQYVSPGVIGYEDLDNYGTWQTTQPYGSVWVPASVPVGWAPYRFGHWAWIAPWGWTWIDNAPWGFAPFHYGRWVNTGGYWGWAPGPYRSWSPCYSPALVAWVGGPGWGAGFGFGGAGWGVGVNFGWFPLGWGEPYYPWYHGWHGRGLSSAYIRNVNVTNTYITNVTNITGNYYHNRVTNVNYVNRTVRGAVTAAPGSAIANGQMMNHAGRVVPSSALMHAPAMRSINVAPTHSAMLGGQPSRDRALPPASAAGRNVVTHTSPPTMVARENGPRMGATAGAGAVNSPRWGGSNAPYAVHRPDTVNGWRGNAAGRPSQATSASLASRTAPQATSGAAVQGRPAANENMGAMHPPTPATPSSAAVHPSAGQSRAAAEPRDAYVPRPPASYTYHAAPGYAGGTRTESGLTVTGGRVTGNSNSAATRVYSPAQGYNGHGGYSATAPSAGSNRGSSSAESHISRPSMAAAPRYSAPSGSAVHYSAPSGGGHYAAPSGGGHYSAPSGGGNGGGGSSHAMHPSGGNKSR